MTMPSILVVENNEGFRDLVERILSEPGFKVVGARIPGEATGLAEIHHFAAAVIDVRLRDDDDSFDRSGLVLARQLGEKMPVVILTAYDDPAAIERAYEAAPGAPHIRMFISKNDYGWETKLKQVLSESVQNKQGIREWISSHWSDLVKAIGGLIKKRLGIP